MQLEIDHSVNKMIQKILQQARKEGIPLLAILIDPFEASSAEIELLILHEEVYDLILVGGSLADQESVQQCVTLLKNIQSKPVLLFPGSEMQWSEEADGMLLLSLISGRNADWLIGKHVQASVALAKTNLELIPTGYILVESGPLTSVQYITQTLPIPSQKSDLARATALAGQQLGMKAIYLEAGSGAKHPVSLEMIQEVKQIISIPLIVGGGIRTIEQLNGVIEAGADMVVIGTAFEHNPQLLEAFGEAFQKFRTRNNA